MLHQHNGKELHESNGWFDAFDLCHIIGFRSPRDSIRRYVSKDDKKAVGLDTYINENGVWSLVYAPTVRADTKKSISKWLRSEVFLNDVKGDKATGADIGSHSFNIDIGTPSMPIKLKVRITPTAREAAVKITW